MSPYNYLAQVIRVIDGDTLECMVDLGFNIHQKATLRLLDVNAPETRTLDLEEKVRGLKIKAKLTKLLNLHDNKILLRTTRTGKYGRWLADIYIDDVSVNNKVDEWTKEVMAENISADDQD